MQTAGPPSQLFTVRLWLACAADGELTWRGKVTHVLSGETRYFREWAQLIRFMEDIRELGGLPPALPAPANDGASGRASV
jgi:hypothetical protein